MPSDRYTKKPVTVEAIQYTGANLREVLDFTGKHPRWGEWFKSFEDYEAHVCSDRGVFKILTLEGTMEALPGDWIIRGVKGEHYPCKPDIFAATYARSDLCASGQQVRALMERWLDGEFEGTADEAAQIAIEEQGADLDATPVIEAWLIALAALTPPPQPDTCWRCGGTGLALNYAGEPGLCSTCKGDTVTVPQPSAATPPQPSVSVAEALREIRAAIQDGNLSQGIRLDIIDKIALRALKGGE
ncbi:hypothetical protein [Paracoccus sp. SSJ]|uniref:hypothetical protein n=1 Tax=Paracoccus sp. SSJ TaxID=3050636 RepID=UPI00254BEA1E|nr:hypothetical protein [Paracoccus sp. SSJ]MDK8874360.1 hypothetical protein [Paracoccus sp. SSJ]